jgi:hypothetical protein
MGFAENSLPEIRGRQELEELVRATFSALESESEIVHALRERVFARDPDELLDSVVSNGVCVWSFKPMVELLLRELLYLAREDRIPADERRQDMAAAIVLAGF